MQGDLKEWAANTLATWGIALNESFLQYFIDKVGYNSQWESFEGGAKPPRRDLLQLLTKDYAAEMRGPDEYKILVEEVLSLHSTQRQRFISQIYEKCLKLNATEPHVAKNLVGAHDMLIGAEVQCYLASEVGKKNLRELHVKSKANK
jgi:hypothetical protein